MTRAAKIVAGFVVGVALALVAVAFRMGPCPECRGSGKSPEGFGRCELCDGVGW